MLLQQLLSSAKVEWRYCKILFRSKKGVHKIKAVGNLHERVGVLLKTGRLPILIIDDAHEINIKGLRYLLEHTLIQKGSRKFKSLILFSEPPAIGFFEELSQSIPSRSVVNKLYIKPFTEEQTAKYLHRFLNQIDPSQKKQFSSAQIKKIYESSDGIPGRINEEAHKILGGRPFWKKGGLLKKILPGSDNS